MNKADLKKTFLFILTMISNIAFLAGQDFNIDYYGIVSTDIDTNMSKMTSDLYYTQLSEIQNFNTDDKRTEICMSKEPEHSLFNQDKLSFYTQINKKEDKWIVTFHVFDKSRNKELTSSREYDSFYKILMESKSTLQESIKNLIQNNVIQNDSQSSPSLSQPSASFNSETISGTWTGEDYIDKIVILRGGRGFVIFNNGASMNITVEIESSSKEQQIVITQKGRANASFYPDLPRNIALNAALSAEPIVWHLKMINSDTLKGSKKTLISNGEDFNYKDINVTWFRAN